MENRQRIAFIRPKAWPLANRIVDGVLKQQFPDHVLDVFDVSQIVRARPDILLINSLATLFYYGLDILRRRKRFRLSFWRTPFIFKQIKKLIAERITKENYCFSFQMQSLFDASTEGLPHFVYTDHTHLENLNYGAGVKKNLYAPAWIELERTIYQKASINFVRSSNVQRSMIHEYDCPPDRVRLVYAGSNATINSTRNGNSDYTDQHILFIGFDWQRKGGPDLVEAFKRVLEKCPQAWLTIVGASPEVDVPNCDVVGRGRPEELDRYYQRASVFCMPTYREPFGIVFIEAMAARLPIVATRVGAIPDFVEDGWNGWLVEPGNVQGLADALIRLLQDPVMARDFGQRSYEIIRERYSWDFVGKRIRQNICELLSRERIGTAP